MIQNKAPAATGPKGPSVKATADYSADAAKAMTSTLSFESKPPPAPTRGTMGYADSSLRDAAAVAQGAAAPPRLGNRPKGEQAKTLLMGQSGAAAAAAAQAEAFNATLVAGEAGPAHGDPALMKTMVGMGQSQPPPPASVPAASEPDTHDSFSATVAAESMQLMTTSGGAAPVTFVQAPPTSLVAPSTAAPSSLFRSTVLPKIELDGPSPRLVQEGRIRYEETKKLGEGGVGEVVKAHDNDIHREVAVKRLKPDVLSAPALARFVEEIRTVGRLEHPNIVPVHDVGVDELGQFYFVMKYVNGENLESIIEKLAAGDPVYHQRYPFERRVQIFQGILEAMHYAHANGVVHRDIKPANIMVGPYGEVVVMDWGLAKEKKGTLAALPPVEQDGAPSAAVNEKKRLFETRVGQLLGTPAYMSPEQARGAHDVVDERSDVYSLTALFYELLTLKHYLTDKSTLPEMLKAVQEETPIFAANHSHPAQQPVPPDLAWYLVRGLEKAPADRYQSVGEMLQLLSDRAAGCIGVHCPATFAKRTSNEVGRFIDRHPKLVAYSVIMSALMLVFGALGGGVFGVLKALGKV